MVINFTKLAQYIWHCYERVLEDKWLGRRRKFFFVRKHLLLFDDRKGKDYFNLDDSSKDVQSILRLRGHFLLDRFQTDQEALLYEQTAYQLSHYHNGISIMSVSISTHGAIQDYVPLSLLVVPNLNWTVIASTAGRSSP